MVRFLPGMICVSQQLVVGNKLDVIFDYRGNIAVCPSTSIRFLKYTTFL